MLSMYKARGSTPGMGGAGEGKERKGGRMIGEGGKERTDSS